MRLKTVVIALIFSLVFAVSRASYADTLTMTGFSGQAEDYEFVYPYIFQVDGPNGTTSYVDMSCLNYDRDVSFEQPWDVTAINVSTIAPTDMIDGESGLDFLADAYLYNQYPATDWNQLTSEVQYAIWSIMDPTGIASEDGFDAEAKSLASAAKAAAPAALPRLTAELLDLAEYPVDVAGVLAQDAALQHERVVPARAVPHLAEAVDALVGVEADDGAGHRRTGDDQHPHVGDLQLRRFGVGVDVLRKGLQRVVSPEAEAHGSGHALKERAPPAGRGTKLHSEPSLNLHLVGQAEACPTSLMPKPPAAWHAYSQR